MLVFDGFCRGLHRLGKHGSPAHWLFVFDGFCRVSGAWMAEVEVDSRCLFLMVFVGFATHWASRVRRGIDYLFLMVFVGFRPELDNQCLFLMVLVGFRA